MKELIAVVIVGCTLLLGAIMVAGPTAGEHSIAYKVSMHLYTGK